MERYRTFREFWPYYVSQHMKPNNRLFHFIGLSLALLFLGNGLLREAAWLSGYPWGAVTISEFIIDAGVMTTNLLLVNLLRGVICGYGFGWAGHVLFEKNKPASFHSWQFAKWSFLSDWKMCWLMWRGKMENEVQKVERLQEAARHAGEDFAKRSAERRSNIYNFPKNKNR